MTAPGNPGKVPNWHIPADWTLGEGELREAVNRFGTPLYIFDASIIKKRMRTLRQALPEETRVYYSVKANPAPEVVALLGAGGGLLEISSLGEFDLATRCGVTPAQLIWVSPGKSDLELGVAVEREVGLLVADSPGELSRIAAAAKEHGKVQRVALRLNPGRGRGALSMAGATHLGMDREAALKAIKIATAKSHVELIGVHTFLGTRNLEAVELVKNFEMSLLEIDLLEQESGCRFSFIDVGGGFGVPLYEGEEALDMNLFKELTAKLFGGYRENHPWVETVAVEAGRFLVAEAGVLVTTVLDVKVTHNENFVVVDGGINVIGGRDAYIGARATPLILLGGAGPLSPFTICGPLCTPFDRLARNILMEAPSRGDLIAFFNAGAYGASASPTNFLGHGAPREVIYRDGDFYLT